MYSDSGVRDTRPGVLMRRPDDTQARPARRYIRRPFIIMMLEPASQVRATHLNEFLEDCGRTRAPFNSQFIYDKWQHM